MGINLKIYYLYHWAQEKFVLIRANRPGYRNSDQGQENYAGDILDAKVKLLLSKYFESEKLKASPELIGVFQGLPEGDILYKKNGVKGLKNLRFVKTVFKNAVFISIAENEDEFLTIIEEEDFADNGWTKKELILPSKSIDSVDFITENDFDLSSIPNAYSNDLEDGVKQ